MTIVDLESLRLEHGAHRNGVTTIASPVPQAPVRSLEQRRDALRRANEVRARRVGLKREMRMSATFARQLAVEVLSDPPEWAAAMRTVELVLAIPMIGKTKARRILFRLRISESKTLGGLSDRQRAELVQLLGGDR